MELFLIDGTYELFRHYYAVPSARDRHGREVGVVRGVLASVLGMIKGGATHVAVATDHVRESLRKQSERDCQVTVPTVTVPQPELTEQGRRPVPHLAGLQESRLDLPPCLSAD